MQGYTKDQSGQKTYTLIYGRSSANSREYRKQNNLYSFGKIVKVLKKMKYQNN